MHTPECPNCHGDALVMQFFVHIESDWSLHNYIRIKFICQSCGKEFERTTKEVKVE